MARFKVVELSTVTDEAIEGVLNEWCERDWELHDIRFVLREGSRRPAMAFVILSSVGEDDPSLPPVERSKAGS